MTKHLQRAEFIKRTSNPCLTAIVFSFFTKVTSTKTTTRNATKHSIFENYYQNHRNQMKAEKRWPLKIQNSHQEKHIVLIS
jgi:hypothetical protein